MLDPSTSPSGRNPASRTSRNSFTDRSEVNSDVACPGRIPARRRMASSGMPMLLAATVIWRLRGIRSGPPQREDGQGVGRGAAPTVEPGDGGADDGRLGQVVAVVVARLDGPEVETHRGDDGAVSAGALDALAEALARVGAGELDELGVAGDLDVAGEEAGRLLPGAPVVVADRDRDAD